MLVFYGSETHASPAWPWASPIPLLSRKHGYLLVVDIGKPFESIQNEFHNIVEVWVFHVKTGCLVLQSAVSAEI